MEQPAVVPEGGEAIPPGPRIAMFKSSEEVDIITFYARSDYVTDDCYEMRRERWEALGKPEALEIRLEGL